MQDLTLDFENKTISNTFVSKKDLIIQQVTLALQCWAGDWLLNGEYGIDYELKTRNKTMLLSDVQDIILGIDGVLSVDNLILKVTYGDANKKTQRYYNISADITTEDNALILYNDLIPMTNV